jgi:hypothetical protein
LKDVSDEELKLYARHWNKGGSDEHRRKTFAKAATPDETTSIAILHALTAHRPAARYPVAGQ